MTEENLNPKVLGQLLLMQSVLNNLPDNKSIFSFVCKGLLDIPGISKVEYNGTKSGAKDNIPFQLYLPISVSESNFGELKITLSEYDLFKPYERYLGNFVFMIGVILEQRKQSQLIEEHKQLLEQRIQERTYELNLEKEHLAESQRRFKDLMVNVKLISVMLDVKGNIIFCNNYLLELTGYLSDEIMGKNWFEVFLPENIINQVKDIFYGVMKGDELASTFINEIVSKKGETLIVSWNNTILYDAGKKITGIASIGVDITQRIRDEILLKEKSDEIEAQNEEYQQLNEELNQINQELIYSKQRVEESEERFRLMLKNSNDTFVLINAQGEQFYITDAAVRDTGFSIEELKGPISNVIYPDDLDIVLKAWNEVLTKKGENVRVQYRHKHKYKDYIWYEAVAQNYLDNPAIKAVVVNVRDITNIKETEIELIKAKEKAEESDHLKTAFLQNMSHEIRTPMNAIMGFSELLSSNFNDKAKLSKFSKIITQRCNDLLDIINDILDIAKIESGQLPVNLEEFNLDELFTELSSFFKEYQKRIGKEHIEFNFHSECQSYNSHIVSDKVKLKQIFINLISNAFKYTNTGNISAGCKLDQDNKLVFYVSDTGIGIPADKQELVFERFAQLHYGPKSNIGGTGLGLPIVKGLIRLLGGTITLESAPGMGSTFTFSVPFKTSLSIPPKPKPSEKFDGNGLNNKIILIVEDDYYNSEYLKEILKEFNLYILQAVTGKEAVEISISHNVDLVLMDIRLPDMQGYEATQQIRKHKPGLKIIAQTAYASNEERQKALDAGCNDYISKPSKRELLLTMINKHLAFKLSN